jgi:hypothetical protein
VSASRVVVSALGGARGASASAAALAALTAAAGRPSLLVRLGTTARPPGLLASAEARDLERSLGALGLPAPAAARGRTCELEVPGGNEGVGQAGAAAAHLPPGSVCVVDAAPPLFRDAVEDPRLAATAAVLQAELPDQRSLAALVSGDLIRRGLIVRVLAARAAWAPLAALAGASPDRRLARLADRLSDRSGQALPLALGAVAVLLIAVAGLVAVAGALSGKGRVQRAADLAALAAARSLRDDLDRLLAPARLPDGRANPRHLGKAAYLRRARGMARSTAVANGVGPQRLRVSFPDAESFAPLRARALVLGSLRGTSTEVRASAVAEAVPEAGAPAAAPAYGSGGGYSGPLAYRQGEGMRPDVAGAYDRMAAVAATDGVTLVVTSGFRSDAEQAALFAANPDPRWVAPPGQSLHRCATELDLGPPAAYGWLAANASRFGFVQRYSWEPWHFGFAAGPAPCSAAGNAVTGAGDDRGAGGLGLPAFVPARFRRPLLASAARWDVSAAMLAAQLMAESNFDPNAVSSAGAQGIAQFIPSTAAAYGLHDPFDPEAAIDAQAQLMSDLLEQFEGAVPLALAAYNAGPAPVAACGCVPAIPETTAYVARIMGLLDGAGVLVAPPLEVRLIQ